MEQNLQFLQFYVNDVLKSRLLTMSRLAISFQIKTKSHAAQSEFHGHLDVASIAYALFDCLMARSHQKYFTSDGHQMAIGQNEFIYNTITHSHTSDAERMENGFRQEQKCHINKEKYIVQHNKNKLKCA